MPLAIVIALNGVIWLVLGAAWMWGDNPWSYPDWVRPPMILAMDILKSWLPVVLWFTVASLILTVVGQHIAQHWFRQGPR